jgi:hypothetical protein
MAQLDLGFRDIYTLRMRAAVLSREFNAAIKRRGTRREVASELDQVFGELGRPVSEAVLKAAISEESERNYSRLEWLVIVMDDPAVQAALKPPTMEPAEELRLMREFMRQNASGLVTSFDRSLGRST